MHFKHSYVERNYRHDKHIGEELFQWVHQALRGSHKHVNAYSCNTFSVDIQRKNLKIAMSHRLSWQVPKTQNSAWRGNFVLVFLGDFLPTAPRKSSGFRVYSICHTRQKMLCVGCASKCTGEIPPHIRRYIALHPKATRETPSRKNTAEWCIKKTYHHTEPPLFACRHPTALSPRQRRTQSHQPAPHRKASMDDNRFVNDPQHPLQPIKIETIRSMGF